MPVTAAREERQPTDVHVIAALTQIVRFGAAPNSYTQTKVADQIGGSMCGPRRGIATVRDHWNSHLAAQGRPGVIGAGWWYLRGNAAARGGYWDEMPSASGWARR
jgi:hypothetical protein